MARTLVSRSLVARTLVARGAAGEDRPPAPSSGAPVLSNITASNVGSESATISWSVDQPATGQVNYGTTASYGLSTTAESSFDYSAHVQAISGLATGTEYHYRVRSTNQAAQETISGDYTFTTTNPTSTYPGTAAIINVAVNSDSMPSYLGTITDSTWGTEIMRVSNTSGYAAGYAKQMAWNSDGTRLFLGQGFRMLNATDYTDYGNSHRPFGAEFPVWSNVTATKMYGCADGVGKLRSWSTSGLTWSDVANFALNNISGQARAYNHCSLGNYEGNISNDDHLIALVCNTLANRTGQWDVIAYDPIDNVVRGTLANVGGDVDNCGVSQSGDYVYVNGTGDGSGTYQGLRIYNADMTLVRQVVTYRPHLDMGYDSSGNEVLVNAQAGNMHRLSNGTTTDLFPGALTAVDGGHVSCRNVDLPGWAFFSDSQSQHSAKPGYGQLVSVKLDGSGTVRIYGCHHEVNNLSDNGNYAVPNRDGSKVVFASRWGGSSLYGFVAGVNV